MQSYTFLFVFRLPRAHIDSGSRILGAHAFSPGTTQQEIVIPRPDRGSTNIKQKPSQIERQNLDVQLLSLPIFVPAKRRPLAAPQSSRGRSPRPRAFSWNELHFAKVSGPIRLSSVGRYRRFCRVLYGPGHRKIRAEKEALLYLRPKSSFRL